MSTTFWDAHPKGTSPGEVFSDSVAFREGVMGLNGKKRLEEEAYCSRGQVHVDSRFYNLVVCATTCISV